MAKRTKLGTIITEFSMSEVNRILGHRDVSMWNAPSECHEDVNKSWVESQKKLECLYGTRKELVEMFEEMGLDFNLCENKAVDKLLDKYNPWN